MNWNKELPDFQKVLKKVLIAFDLGGAVDYAAGYFEYDERGEVLGVFVPEWKMVSRDSVIGWSFIEPIN